MCLPAKLHLLCSTIDQIRELMDKQYNIRNMSVIAHVDHGLSLHRCLLNTSLLQSMLALLSS